MNLGVFICVAAEPMIVLCYKLFVTPNPMFIVDTGILQQRGTKVCIIHSNVRHKDYQKSNVLPRESPVHIITESCLLIDIQCQRADNLVLLFEPSVPG